MKTAPAVRGNVSFRSRTPRLTGFTILELLVAMAVLSIILAMLVQVVDGLLQATNIQNQKIESVASARRALDVLTSDLKNAVISENSSILVPDNGNLLALLTTRRGPNAATNHRLLAVNYATNAVNELYRSYGSVSFGQTNPIASAASALTQPDDPLSKGILAIQARAITDGTNSYELGSAASANWSSNTYNGLDVPTGHKALITAIPVFAANLTNRTRALEFWVVAVDDLNYQILKESGGLATVQQDLGDDPALWRSEIDASAIPAKTKSSIQVLNKTIPLR